MKKNVVSVIKRGLEFVLMEVKNREGNREFISFEWYLELNLEDKFMVNVYDFRLLSSFYGCNFRLFRRIIIIRRLLELGIVLNSL